MATVEQTMMKVQRILTGPMGLKVMLESDRFRVNFRSTNGEPTRTASLAPSSRSRLPFFER